MHTRFTGTYRSTVASCLESLQVRDRHVADALDDLLPSCAAIDPNTPCLAEMDRETWKAYVWNFTAVSAPSCHAQLRALYGQPDWLVWKLCARQEG